MEATGIYWKPVWRVLEDAPSLELLLVNPAHFKNLPGRKTDVKDSEWLAQLLECGLLRGSFIPPRTSPSFGTSPATAPRSFGCGSFGGTVR